MKRKTSRAPTEEMQVRNQRRQNGLRDAALWEDVLELPDLPDVIEPVQGLRDQFQFASLEKVVSALHEERERGAAPELGEDITEFLARRNRLAHVKHTAPLTRRVQASEELEAIAKGAGERVREVYFVDSHVCMPKRPPLKRLANFADWWPLDLRKRLKALAGDYDAEILRLQQEGRHPAARWNKWLAWSVAIWYVLRAPADRVALLLVKATTGK